MAKQKPFVCLSLVLLCTVHCGGSESGSPLSPDTGPSLTDSAGFTPAADLQMATDAGCPGETTSCGSICCTSEQVCLEGTCHDLGGSCDELWPCDTDEYCDLDRKRCIPGASKCEYRPPVGVFSPKVEWEWQGSNTAPSYNQVMMAPMVANLTDDNNDGTIDREDIPDIAFITFAGNNYTEDGVLRVISGDGKKEHFSITDKAYRTRPGGQLALGDIDNDQLPEIVACASGGGVIAFEHDGTFKWKKASVYCAAPALADLEGDGTVEVISGCNVLEGTTGEIRWQGEGQDLYDPIVSDLNKDDKSEVICGNKAFTFDGQELWHNTDAPKASYQALADLDRDGQPEVVLVNASAHAMWSIHADGSTYWGPVDINQGHATASDKCNGCGGGPPTIANFDDDEKLEIAVAGGWGYVIYEHDGSNKWFTATRDLSSRTTGSSVFDFEGDGQAEVVYSDELQLRIYQGATGKELFSICNTSGTLQEYPLIVDVDNDGHAEIVVANNNYAYNKCDDGSASHTGIKVLGDAQNNWVRTRRIWNQHTYHVTNVDEDGRIPQVEPRHWEHPVLNTFRQNVQPGGLFDAPDLTGQVNTLACPDQLTAQVQVKNDGAAKVMPGLQVALYLEDGQAGVLLATEETTSILLPGQSETVTFSLTMPSDYLDQEVELYAVVDDDGQGAGTINECHEDNNRLLLGTVTCLGIE